MNKYSSKGFFLVGLVIVLFVIALLSGGTYFYFRSGKPEAEKSEYITVKAKNDSIIQNILSVRPQAEIIYNETGGYGGVGCDDSRLSDLCGAVEEIAGEQPTFYSKQGAYCVYVKLAGGDYYCADSLLHAVRINISPDESGYCDGETFICPISNILE